MVCVHMANVNNTQSVRHCAKDFTWIIPTTINSRYSNHPHFTVAETEILAQAHKGGDRARTGVWLAINSTLSHRIVENHIKI